ncbi:MAG: right-handed parallel beta-helix repeat-containing protein [Ignavibacteriales bacterium]|nr:right-handed parallel beta-helix repeat-containing protein [Ignavibacteriales bacterium]
MKTFLRCFSSLLAITFFIAVIATGQEPWSNPIVKANRSEIFQLNKNAESLSLQQKEKGASLNANIKDESFKNNEDIKGGALNHPLVSPHSANSEKQIFTPDKTNSAAALNGLTVIGDPANINSALVAGANYVKHAQSDVTEDNAGNGNPDTDNNDGGWDWMLTLPNVTHSASASPKNLYGATGLGLYYGYIRTNDASLKTAMQDAADKMIADASVRDASALKFLMLYNDLPGVAGTAYKDAAKSKYDARIAANGGTATLFAQYIRDQRGITQGYHNGIIGWDLGAWAVAAQMLYDRFGGIYHTDAGDIADVAYNASFVTNANYFDLVRCAGWDPTWATVDYWWYNLGVSGLIDAFHASGTHTSDVPGLVTKLQNSQASFGGFCGSYGVHTNDDDWQTTAYAVMTLAALNPSTYETEINHGAYYLAATQNANGGWVYSDNTHYPEIGGECTSALYFGSNASTVWVDDDYTPSSCGGHLWGFDAFSTIQNGIDGVASGGTVNVYPGFYIETASNRSPVSVPGTYTFGLYIGQDKNGITVQGVNASGNIITDYHDIVASVQTEATNNFGPDGIFMEGDDVTITGLSIWQDTLLGTNKTISVVGDNFTFKYCHLTDVSSVNPWGSLYIDDEMYDEGSNISHIQRYTIEGNWFDHCSIDPNNGAGYTGPVSGRVIKNNLIDLGSYAGASISFTGSGTPVPWFVHGVGGAVITGNTFLHNSQHIRARGDYDNAQFDWSSYWNNNSFDNAVVVGSSPPSDIREYSYTGGYGVINHCRRIGGNIQSEINHALTNDIVKVGAGTYNEHDITINLPLTVIGNPGDAQPGPGVNAPIIDGQNLWSDAFLLADGVSNVTIQGFEIRNYAWDGSGNGNGVGNAVQAWVASTSYITVSDNYMHHLSWNGVLVGNDGAIGDHTYWTIARNVLTDFGPTTFTNSGYGLELTNTSYGVIEDNIIDGGSRYPGIGILVTMRRLAGQDIVIQRNSIRGQFDNAGIYVGGFGYEVPNNNLNNVQIRNNDVEIYGPTIRALNLRDYATGTLTNVTVFDNKLIKTGGYGVANNTAQMVNASSNWWGSSDPTTVAGRINANVDYTPWLNIGTDTQLGTLGFQGDFSNLWVDDGSPQIGSTGRIQEGIDMVTGSTVNLAAGTYTENVNVNKKVTLQGAGSGSDPASNTIITNSLNGRVVLLTASGTSMVSPVLLQNFRIVPVGINGLEVTNATTVSYVKLENVFVVGPLPRTIENENGFKIATDGSLMHMTMNNCSFQYCDYGWYFAKHGDWGPGGSNVVDMTVTNTTFLNNDYKGIYVEKLSDATFTNVVISNNGSSSFWNDTWNGGVDINLKGEELYQNLVFNNLTVTNNGLSFKEGAGMMIKARGTGADNGGGGAYALHPATLNNVTINGGTFTGNERGIRFGEPGKSNTTPTNVTIHNATITGNIRTYSGTDGSTYGGVVNQTTALTDAMRNWWGDATGPYNTPSNTCGLGDSVSTNVDFIPWFTDAGMTGTATGTPNVHNVTQGTYFCTIQGAIDAPTTLNGDLITVAAGSYSEILNVHKSVTLQGANADINPNTGIRGAETIIDESAISTGGSTNFQLIQITSSGKVVINGFKFIDNDITATGMRHLIYIPTSATHEIKYNIFSRAATTSISSADPRAITVTPSAIGTITVDQNLFLGSSTADLFNNKGWRRGVWSDGGGIATTITNNVFQYCRSAINLDSYTAAASVTGNTFQENGTALSFGLVGAGNYTISGNIFNNAASSTVINLSGGIDPSAFFDATANTYDGLIPTAMTLDQLFALEYRMVHRMNTGKNGFVSVKTNNVYVVPALYGKTGSIQGGVDAASNGWTVNVAAGTYEEQVEINKQLNLSGQSMASTIIKSPVTLTKFFTTGSNNNYPIVYVHDASNVAISNFTVDGFGRGNANYRFIGIGYRNAGGTVSGSTIQDIRNNPIDGSQHGVGLYANADDGNARTLNVANNTIFGFQKNGTVFTGGNLTVSANGNTITGAGAVSFIAQNGIQIYGAAGSASGNHIAGFSYTPGTWTSTGMLIYNALGSISVTGNKIDECQTGIYYINAQGTISQDTVTNTVAGMGATPYWWGIVADPGIGKSQLPEVSGFDIESVPKKAASINSVTALTTIVNLNVMNGGGNGTGIEADALGTETLNFSANENTVSNWGTGFVFYKETGATLNGVMRRNSITGNIYGVLDQTGVLQDARENWWGSSTGPADPKLLPATPNYNNPMGIGDSVSAFIDYNPWYLDPGMTLLSLYTLTVNTSNGSIDVTPPTGPYNHGTILSLVPVPNIGYHFVNWSGADVPAGHENDNPLLLTMDANKTITANFAINTYTLTINATNGSVNVTPPTGPYNHGTILSLAPVPIIGYHFVNWSGADVPAGHTTDNPLLLTMDAHKTITANFAINTYTLTVNAAHGTVQKIPDQLTYDYGTLVQLIPSPAVDYHFNNWTGDFPAGHGSDNPLNVVMDQNRTITAVFLPNPIPPTYIINATAGAGGIISPSGILTFDEGENQTFTVTPDPHYHIDTVIVDNVSVGAVPSYTFTNIVTDHTIRAVFGIDLFSVTVNSVGNGSVTKVPDYSWYGYGSIVQLQADAELGWKFSHWSGDIIGAANPYPLTVDGDKSITANFIEDSLYQISYRSFAADSIALDKDNKGKINKYVMKKPVRVYFECTIPNNTVKKQINFHIHFEPVLISGNPNYPLIITPTPLSTSFAKQNRILNVTWSDSILPGETIKITGWGAKGKGMKVSYAWSIYAGGKHYDENINPVNQLFLAMPNRVNALYETFRQGGYDFTGGLLVGLNRKNGIDSSKYYGWLQSKNYKNVLQSLVAKKGSALHNGIARGFDQFTNHRYITGAQKFISPEKHNNVLLAEMIALKVNIAASALGITPHGFGELKYDDGTSNPLNGLMLKVIGDYGDELIMGVYDDVSHKKLFADQSLFNNLSETLHRINTAFEGEMDTISFADELVIKGTKKLIDVPFLRANPLEIPAIIIPLDHPEPEIPSGYALDQNYPNPFNPTTVISYQLPVDSWVTLKIFNMIGQEVKTLIDHQLIESGVQDFEFDANGLPSGVYFYRLIANGLRDDEEGVAGESYTSVKKMILLR